VSIQAFLKQRAVNIAVGGNYKLLNWYDSQGKQRIFACQTRRVSPFRMIVEGPVVGKIGERISSYFGDFGNLDGHIIDTMAGGFLFELAIDEAMRGKLANQLTWLEQRQKNPGVRDAREHARIIPAMPHSSLILADGSVRSCFVSNLSATGAAVSADVQLEVGAPLAVGPFVGRVVRIESDRFAVKFLEQWNRDEIERRIVRPPAPLSAVK
jgi:hypothetical protein